MTDKTKYSLHSKGQSGWQFLMSPADESPRAAFERALDVYGVKEAEATSFLRVGDNVELTGRHTIGGVETVTSFDERGPGKEMIYEVRGLPDLSSDAHVMFGYFARPVNPANMVLPQEKRLTERAEEAIEELISAGLVYVKQSPVTGGKCYTTTDLGMTYPDRSDEVIAKKGSFKELEPIEVTPEASDEPGI